MSDKEYKIWDPVHNFIELDSYEIKVLNSRPLQRLRYIHQLGMTHFIYPGASHTRFEHSLGVMELAARVFDIVTDPDHLIAEAEDALPELQDECTCTYWRQVLRMAALCHDVGHLPFSHAAEDTLLPKGWDHERLTKAVIESNEMSDLWKSFQPPLDSEHIAKLAVGLEKYGERDPSEIERVLAEIITGDAFGVDRMDYLLRDSHHLGIPSGTFDYHRLIDTLRILPVPPADPYERSTKPTLGVERGGLACAEALLLARYFMFTTVYFHNVRLIYDRHLQDFLEQWEKLNGGRFPTDVDLHLSLADHDVMSSMLEAAYDEANPNHQNARRIVCREHFRRVYSPGWDTKNPREECEQVYETLVSKFGQDNVRQHDYYEKRKSHDFPVLDEGESISASAVSEVVTKLPLVKADYVFIHPDDLEEAKAWVEENKGDIEGHKGGDTK